MPTITPDQIALLSQLADLPLTALLLLLVAILFYVIYTLWQRIIVLESRLDECLGKQAK